MSQVLEFVASVVRNLREPSRGTIQWWLGHPLELQAGLAKALEFLDSIPMKIWRAIKLGNAFKSADDFRSVMAEEGCRISDWANDMMSKSDFAKSLVGVSPDEEFDLVDMTTAELIGENRDGTTDKVFAGAHRLGLEECPAWMGPKVRLEYKNQPNGEWILIGMKPLRDSDGDLNVFRVGRADSEFWLLSEYGYPDRVWSASGRWLFRRPRKCQKSLDS